MAERWRRGAWSRKGSRAGCRTILCPWRIAKKGATVAGVEGGVMVDQAGSMPSVLH